MLRYIFHDPHYGLDFLGYLPGFLSEDDPRPAREQLDANYQHGGGWQPLKGWEIVDHITPAIQYPGDPPLTPIAGTVLHGSERIIFFPHAQVMIWQEDGSFEVARMD